MGNKNNVPESRNQNNKQQDNKNYVAYGISIGMCIGTAIGLAMENLSMGTGLGMMVGVAVGTILQQKKDKDEGESL